MKRITFISKAQNLNYLTKLYSKKINVPNFFFFKISDWIDNSEEILKKAKHNLSNNVCIRSSYLGEDGKKNSMAGKFNSFINIRNNYDILKIKINLLIQQYKKIDKTINIKNHEILIQNFVQNNVCSGVMTNFSLRDGSPYFTINYDDVTKSTESVTSGSKESHRVLHVYKNSKNKIRNTKFKNLIKIFQFIEKNYSYIPLDIEFAIDKYEKIYILQIRPITFNSSKPKYNEINYSNKLKYYEKKYNILKKKYSKYSKNLIFSNMSDWNPAEIIGIQPDYLSYSLYEYFVTNKSWFSARKQMGYGSGKSDKLMQQFLGKPFINLNLSFNSLIPSNVKKETKNKLVNHWLNEIKLKPYLHDKVEIDIVQNCFYFGVKKKLLSYDFLSNNEKKVFYLNLKIHTEDLINEFKFKTTSLLNQLLNLEETRENIIKNYINKKKSQQILITLSNKLKKCGIIPFAKIARYAFIAKKILQSMVDEKIITKKCYYNILKKSDTITNRFVIDKKKLLLNRISKKSFFNMYYHLRPGTYNIRSKRYCKKIDVYSISNQIQNILSFKYLNINEILTKNNKLKINSYIKKNNINIDIDNLFFFLINSTRLRENSKFIFTRSLSDIIELIKLNVINKKQKLENINFHKFLSSKKKNSKVYNIYNNEFDNEVSRTSKLPYLIQSNNDFYVASVLISKPNFITSKKIKGKLYYLKSGTNKNTNLSNKIIMIENADPGFDWIFAKNISGLITKFGGINSHMSIRCEEKQIPAIIGMGEDNFSKLHKKNYIEIDCKLEKIDLVA
jgi:phosphohistidine swiveling domain-containing protein